MSEKHAYLAPSMAPMWGHCSGAPAAQLPFVNQETEDNRAGTATHWLAAEVLRAYKDLDNNRILCSDYLGVQAPNGVVIDEKMVDGAQIYINEVLGVCQQFGGLRALLVEHRVHMPTIHADNWGTLDAALYLPDRSVLFLWDYKHGHRERPAVEDLQLIDYAQGLVEHFGINGYTEQQTTLVMRVVQPYCFQNTGPVSEWCVPLYHLRAYWNTLHWKAHEATTSPTLTTGKWCRDCLAVGKCAATRRARYNWIELADQPYEMDEMDGHDLAAEREILRDGLAVAQSRLEAIEDELRQRITNGDTSSGLTLETGPGRLEWARPTAECKAMAAMFGVDIAKDAVLTPTQTLAKADKTTQPMLSAVLGNFTRRPAGSLQLVPVDQSRTARAFKKRSL